MLTPRRCARSSPSAARSASDAGDRSRASLVYDLIGPLNDGVYGGREPEYGRPPLGVPTTAIYSRYDGIVLWSACIDEAGPRRENIEVIGTHTGLGFNFAAVWATLDRLSRPAEGWTPFRPPRALRHLYRKAAVWDPIRGRATD